MGFDEGVVEEDVGGGNLVEHLVGVGGRSGVGEGEALDEGGGRDGAEGEAGGDEMGVGLLHLFHGFA